MITICGGVFGSQWAAYYNKEDVTVSLRDAAKMGLEKGPSWMGCIMVSDPARLERAKALLGPAGPPRPLEKLVGEEEHLALYGPEGSVTQADRAWWAAWVAERGGEMPLHLR